MIGRSALPLIIGLLLLVQSPAAADATFVGASPASNATVGGAVSSVQIVFNEVVSQASITIDGPDGPLQLSALVDSGQVISASFAELSAEGRYVVRYAVISADTDPVDGVFAFMFRAGAPRPLPVAAPALADGEPDWLLVAIVAAVVATVVIVGAQTVMRSRRLRQLMSSQGVPSDR
ncbi:MAG: copper resistance CopC family protein [Acidimicrobiia bacterium]